MQWPVWDLDAANPHVAIKQKWEIACYECTSICKTINILIVQFVGLQFADKAQTMIALYDFLEIFLTPMIL